MTALFSESHYTLRRRIFTLLHGKFELTNQAGQQVGFGRMKAFKLREDLRIYRSEAMDEELLRIEARQVIDFGATYDVYDSHTGQAIGSLRRRGFKSILRDEWTILDPGGIEIGTIREDSAALALFRRFVTPILFPQSYHCTLGQRQVATYRQNFNPFVMKIHIDFSLDPEGTYDRRLGVAAALLLCSIEGKQDS